MPAELTLNDLEGLESELEWLNGCLEAALANTPDKLKRRNMALEKRLKQANDLIAAYDNAERMRLESMLKGKNFNLEEWLVGEKLVKAKQRKTPLTSGGEQQQFN